MSGAVRGEVEEGEVVTPSSLRPAPNHMQISSAPSQCSVRSGAPATSAASSDASHACEDDAVSFYDEVGGHPTFAALVHRFYPQRSGKGSRVRCHNCHGANDRGSLHPVWGAQRSAIT